MKKVILLSLGLLGFLLIIAILAGIKISQITTLIESGKAQTIPPVSVSTVRVINHQWENTLSSIGSLEAAKGLLVTSDLPGRVAGIEFDAGSEVKAGDLLIQQDTSTEQAQLRSATAAATLAKTNLKRIEGLYRKKVASKSEYDSAVSRYDSAVADVDNISATIAKKSIRAPFDGRLGIRLVNLGQTIDAGQPVVSLQATYQMFVNFSLPQQHLSKIRPQLPVRLTTDALPGRQFTGMINVIDPEIDIATRSIKLQAILDNPEQALLPGMFASIVVILPEVSDVLLIPITAIQYATFGDSVFVIEAAEDDPEKLIARQQFVRLGETRGDYVVVTKGLAAGQQVATQGVFKLRNGAAVAVNNRVVPDYSLNPAVVDQ